MAGATLPMPAGPTMSDLEQAYREGCLDAWKRDVMDRMDTFGRKLDDISDKLFTSVDPPSHAIRLDRVERILNLVGWIVGITTPILVTLLASLIVGLLTGQVKIISAGP